MIKEYYLAYYNLRIIELTVDSDKLTIKYYNGKGIPINASDFFDKYNDVYYDIHNFHKEELKQLSPEELLDFVANNGAYNVANHSFALLMKDIADYILANTNLDRQSKYVIDKSVVMPDKNYTLNAITDGYLDYIIATDILLSNYEDFVEFEDNLYKVTEIIITTEEHGNTTTIYVELPKFYNRITTLTIDRTNKYDD